MRFYNLLFVGPVQIADRTEYKGVSEHVAAWGLGLILVLNFIVVTGLTTLGQTILRPYILIPLYGVTIFLNLKYYNANKLKLDKLSADIKEKFRPNMTPGELLGIILIIESVSAVLIFGLSRQ